MADSGALEEVLAGAHVDAAVFALRPDYRALLVAVDGLVPGPSDPTSEALLRAAEAHAREALRDRAGRAAPARRRLAGGLPGVRRETAAHPQQPRGAAASAADGLPRVNRLTDLYNAVSVLHQIPLGGEDLTRYSGAPRLFRATGAEPFDTVAGGEAVVEHPEPGEVVWCDEAGVTCRRWNWRQARRTQLREDTTTPCSSSTRSTR